MRAAEIERRTDCVVWRPPVICEVRGCGREALPGADMCADCRDIDLEYERFWDQRRKMQTHATRLRNFAWLVLFLALMSWLGWEMWPQILVSLNEWWGAN